MRALADDPIFRLRAQVSGTRAEKAELEPPAWTEREVVTRKAGRRP
jgi:hypothetical protein